MPTPAVIPRSPFVPRTAQPPYSHVEKPTRAEPNQLGLNFKTSESCFGQYSEFSNLSF